MLIVSKLSGFMLLSRGEVTTCPMDAARGRTRGDKDLEADLPMEDVDIDAGLGSGRRIGSINGGLCSNCCNKMPLLNS